MVLEAHSTDTSKIKNKNSKNLFGIFLSIKPLLCIGGPAYTFLKHQNIDKLIEELLSLYAQLGELGMEYRNGEVYLADVEEEDV
jgi:hypothetical protein